MSALHKTFIAFRLSDLSIIHLQQLQARLKPKLQHVQWVSPENFHITAAFLGNISLAEVTRAAVVLQEFKKSNIPILLKADSLSAFPTEENAKTIYASVGGTQLKIFFEQVKKLRRLLIDHHIVFDEKPFVPHITLGRAKIKKNIAKYKNIQFSKKIVLESVAVYISRFGESGLEYQEVKGL